jgi:hypothetical protein
MNGHAKAQRRRWCPILEKWGRLAAGPAKMAATNKCLARSNKSRTVVPATNKGPAAPESYSGIWFFFLVKAFT